MEEKEGEAFEDMEALIQNIRLQPKLLEDPTIQKTIADFISEHSTMRNAFDFQKSAVINQCRALIGLNQLSINPSAELSENLKVLLAENIILSDHDTQEYYRKLIALAYREKLIDIDKIISLLEQRIPDPFFRLGIIFNLAKENIRDPQLLIYAEKIANTDELREGIIALDIVYGVLDGAEERIKKTPQGDHAYLYLAKAKKEVELGMDHRDSVQKARNSLRFLPNGPKGEIERSIATIEQGLSNRPKKSVRKIYPTLQRLAGDPSCLQECIKILTDPEGYEDNPYTTSELLEMIKKSIMEEPERWRASDLKNAVWNFKNKGLFEEALELMMLPVLEADDRVAYLGEIGNKQRKRGIDTTQILHLLEDMKKNVDTESRIYAEICFAIGLVMPFEAQRKFAFEDSRQAIQAHEHKKTWLGDSVKNSLLLEMCRCQREAELLDDARESLKDMPEEKLNPLYKKEVKNLALTFADKGRFNEAMEVAYELFGADRLILFLDIFDIQSTKLHHGETSSANTKIAS